jgi:hypothetical protein
VLADHPLAPSIATSESRSSALRSWRHLRAPGRGFDQLFEVVPFVARHGGRIAERGGNLRRRPRVCCSCLTAWVRPHYWSGPSPVVARDQMHHAPSIMSSVETATKRVNPAIALGYHDGPRAGVLRPHTRALDVRSTALLHHRR